jgi:hypothetical protein
MSSQLKSHCERSEAIYYEIATLARRSASARRHVTLVPRNDSSTVFDVELRRNELTEAWFLLSFT